VRFDLRTQHVRFAERKWTDHCWNAHVSRLKFRQFPRQAHSGDRVRACGQKVEDGMSFTSWGDALCFCNSSPGTSGEDRDVRVFIPLLDPMCFGGSSREVPFITGIELYRVQGLMGQVECPKRLLSSKTHDDVYEIRFVLDGQGVMRHDGLVQRIETGDAIVFKHGCVEFDGDVYLGEPPGASGMSWSLATFVVYIPMALVDMNIAENHESYDLLLNSVREFANERVWGQDRRQNIQLSQMLSGEESSDVLMSLLGGLKSVELSPHMIPQRVLMSYDENIDIAPGDGGGDFPTVKRTLTDASTYMLPNQTNRLALLFDPFANTPIPFVFGVEIFEPGHRTKPHVHDHAYEVFFILSGQGEGFCGDKRFSVVPGDIVAFHPGNIHGIDNGPNDRMYCIEIMIPDENFAEFVRSGSTDSLELDDLCILIRVGCGS
jgi:quercetin dioxygenase-like cupin family protein